MNRDLVSRVNKAIAGLTVTIDNLVRVVPYLESANVELDGLSAEISAGVVSFEAAQARAEYATAIASAIGDVGSAGVFLSSAVDHMQNAETIVRKL